MPPIEEMDLHDEAVLRTVTGRDRYNEPILSAPSQITCRWDEDRTESIGPDGTPIAIDAAIVTSERIPDQALLWLGTLAAYNATANPEHLQVMTSGKTPSIDGRVYRYEYGLVRYKYLKPEDE